MNYQEYIRLKSQFAREHKQKLEALDLIYGTYRTAGLISVETKTEPEKSVTVRKARRIFRKKSHKKRASGFARPAKLYVLDEIVNLRGEFTSPQLCDILKGKYPEMKARFNNACISPIVSRFRRDGFIEVTGQGHGSKAITYKAVSGRTV